MSKYLYVDEVRLKIGSNNYESILAAASAHKFDRNQFDTFAKMLGDKVGGEHLRRMEEKGHNCDDHEMKRILSDHYCEKMCDMTTEDAVEELNVIIGDYLKIPDVLTAGRSKTSKLKRIIISGSENI